MALIVLTTFAQDLQSIQQTQMLSWVETTTGPAHSPEWEVTCKSMHVCLTHLPTSLTSILLLSRRRREGQGPRGEQGCRQRRCRSGGAEGTRRRYAEVVLYRPLRPSHGVRSYLLSDICISVRALVIAVACFSTVYILHFGFI